MLRPAPLLRLAVLLSPLATCWPSPSGRGFEVPETGTSVPLLDWGGRPVVEARTGDGETLRLIVDTGSSVALVLLGTAAELSELRIGEARLVDPPVTRIDFPLTPPGSSERIDGILGMRAFEDALLVLDFGARRFELRRGALAADAPGTIRFRRDGHGFLTVPLRAGGVELEAHLDTGSPDTLLVPNELAQRLPTKGTPRVRGVARTPMGDAEVREVELVGAVEIGPVRVEDVLLQIADLPQIKGRGVGNVGARLFASSRLTLDVSSQLFVIEASRAEGTSSDLEDLLARMAGELVVLTRLHGAQGEEPRELVGRATCTRPGFGSWRREDFALGDAADARRHGTVYLRPLAEGGRFELVQVDGEHPSALHACGAWNAAARCIVLESIALGEEHEPVPELRWTYRALEDGGFEKRVERVERDGPRLAATHRYTPRS